jgi:hypothetical protein
VASRFPTVQTRRADRTAVSTAMNTAAPGTGVVNELWIDTRGRRRALRNPPFAVLDVSTRRARWRSCADQPRPRGGARPRLGGAGGVGAGSCGRSAGAHIRPRDERGELFDLESQGAEPRTLLRHLRLRFRSPSASASRAGRRDDPERADGCADPADRRRGEAVPPLRLAVDWPLVAIALAAFRRGASPCVRAHPRQVPGGVVRAVEIRDLFRVY